MSLSNAGDNSLNVNQRKRNVGIELLRIVSMFMIVAYHVLSHGGILSSVNSSKNVISIALLNIVCYFAVNLYALISGYVCVNSKHRFSRILELWIEVAGYCLLISVILYILGNPNVGIKQILFSFFPVMNGTYWYFTAYFCLFFFIPFINILIHSLTIKQQRIFIVIGVFIFTVLPALSLCFTSEDVFQIHKGYGPVWLSFLYFVGAHLKISKDANSVVVNKKLRFYLIGFLFNVIIIFIIVCFMPSLNVNLPDMFVRYNSLFYFLGAVSLFLFFANLKKVYFQKIICKIAPASFGVYIISENPMLRDLFINGRFEKAAYLPWYQMIGIVIASALIIYIICTIIDCIRIKIFKLIHIRSLCENLIIFAKLVLNKIYTYSKVIFGGQNAKGIKKDK